MSMRAYIDESMRQRKEDDCVYVLATALVDDDDADDVRDALKRLRYRKNPTIHWYDEHPDRRSKIASAVAELPIRAVVAVAFYPFRGDERARRHCLRALIGHLSSTAVESVLIASRTASLDNADDRLLISMRRQTPQRLPAAQWRRYADEPLLWSGDVFASAVCWSFNDECTYVETMGEQIIYVDAE